MCRCRPLSLSHAQAGLLLLSLPRAAGRGGRGAGRSGLVEGRTHTTAQKHEFAGKGNRIGVQGRLVGKGAPREEEKEKTRAVGKGGMGETASVVDRELVAALGALVEDGLALIGAAELRGVELELGVAALGAVLLHGRAGVLALLHLHRARLLRELRDLEAVHHHGLALEPCGTQHASGTRTEHVCGHGGWGQTAHGRGGVADVAHDDVAVARDRQDRAALAAKVHAARLCLEDVVPALLHTHSPSPFIVVVVVVGG